jgi:hypothetical protein
VRPAAPAASAGPPGLRRAKPMLRPGLQVFTQEAIGILDG